MKTAIKYLLLAVLLISSLVITSCSKDTNPVTSPTNNSGSLTGSWYVDQIQMVQAPTNGTLSALMKASLIPFGLVSASTIGVNNVKFGLEKWLLYYAGSNSLSQIQFLDQQTGWISDTYTGSNAGIYSTVNGGISWSSKSTVSTYANIDCFQFLDANTGFVSARNTSSTTAILKTTNNGVNWVTKYSSSSSSTVRGIYFSDSLNGLWLKDNLLQSTTNGGTNWMTIITNFGNASKLQFTDKQNGRFFCYASGLVKLVKTSDGGNTWITVNCPNFTGYSGFYFLNSTTGWISAYDNTFKYNLYKTVDGGASWTKVNSSKNISNMMFTDNSNGFGIISGKVFQTNDGGNIWNLQTNTSGYLYNLIAFDPSKCYSIGSNGQFLSKGNVIDTAVWTLSGKITSTAIQLLTKSGENDYNAMGVYSLLNNNIVFIVQDYSGGMGNVNSGSGTYSFGANTFSITLSLANSEKWQIVLRR
ncbi:MAG: WD40/YVTN/BNR-like repeat-containing protein [Ignavibacteria bacterium]